MRELEYKLNIKNPYFIKKINQAKKLIKETLNEQKKFFISWSGGKDSTVVLDLVRQNNPDITVLHIKSGYELPDGYNYILNLIKKWELNFVELDTPVDYLALCKEFGLPHLRSKTSQVKIVSKIKKSPSDEWAVKEGYNGLFWGIRAEESLNRKKLYKFKGASFCNKNGNWRISPIMNWTVKDVWTYFEFAKIPINPIYLHENCGFSKENIRNTGWLSTDGESRGQIEWLRKNYPEQYRKIRELL